MSFVLFANVYFYASQVLPDLIDDDETFDYQISLTALTESAGYECHMRSLLDSAISTTLWCLRPGNDPYLHLQLQISWWSHESSTQLLRLLHCRESVSDSFSVIATQATDRDLREHCPLSRSAGAEPTLRLAKRWVETCLNFHSPCRRRSIDWKYEAPRMGSYYLHSVLNIAAEPLKEASVQGDGSYSRANIFGEVPSYPKDRWQCAADD
jgi:hypothetical protein